LLFFAAVPLLTNKGLPVAAEPPRRETSTIAALRAVPKKWPEIPADPATKLLDVFGMIRKVMREECRSDVDFTINFAAFEEVGLNKEKMLDLSPVADRPLEQGSNESLKDYLSRLAERVTDIGPVPDGAVFLLRKKSIELTTNLKTRAEIWASEEGPFLPLAHGEYEKEPLDKVLRELADLAEYNIVVDARVAERAKTPITARFMNAPLDLAVSLLADMAELQPVLQGNILYVTSRENARLLELKKKIAARQSRGQAGPPSRAQDPIPDLP
jgi:hypothetical protein